ncbi:MAG: DUF6544 family protein [Flavobacterium sp.]|uniref:DUF6544 family protein n=1 Tax=Flavobacterium sp. TaxID=239 RepID=UPI003BED6421
MTIVFSILGLLLLALIIVKVNLSIQFHKKIIELFALSKNISQQQFDKSQTDSLPKPVQRYFNYILKEEHSFISYVRIKHEGQFKAGLKKGWMNIKGEQYATTEKPGFIWKGTTAMFIAQDLYIADNGRLIVSLFSLINVVNAKGKQYNQGELLRWLGESILYPTNFLPSDKLKWFPIDDKTAKLTFNYKGLSLFFKITFNDIGEITEMETKRYMGVNNLETWVIKVSDYKELNKVLIPTRFEVLWRLEKGDFCYAKFDITEIEYDKPMKF